MPTQPEATLEANLIQQLSESLGYERVSISSEQDLLQNLKQQLSRHNEIELSDTEFKRILNHLNKGTVFDRAEILRDRFELTRDNGDRAYIQFLNLDHWCQNQYQVTHQISQTGRHKNRYDVTLLINGLPLVQIELKRRGIELKEAFNQINRYHRHSFQANYGLFQYVQLFVISNGVNTKYYANNRKQEYKQTFFWTDAENNLITNLPDFANAFLEKCHVSKMIAKYVVLHQQFKVLMVLRPYQYYAVEAILDRMENSTQNGYIWHTTGSGKTLTSFKASQILLSKPKIDKVVFVVDRNDLDYQTSKEFNHFAPGSVDATSNTRVLVDQFLGQYKEPGTNKPRTSRLIVTTIQKLNNAISNKRYQERMASIQGERIVFIFDECHRSQFGDTHNRIVKYFTNFQMFGFTGTPIFADNAIKVGPLKRTTSDLFGECLHKYVITNAIKDENVLKFAVEYVGRYRRVDTLNEIDIDVHAIDTQELLESENRLGKIVDYLIANHDRKTHNREFSAIFAVTNVKTLIKYYDIFQLKKEAGEHDLRVVTIFTYNPNENDDEANGLIGEPDVEFDNQGPTSEHSRDKLNQYIKDYNAMYGTAHSTSVQGGFYKYYNDISKRFKEREKEAFKDSDRADILLVVNMFLTGFDAKKVNTFYVDKNLRYHSLIQAYSRTNRILGDRKSQGNILSFRNLKEQTDEAIKLFSDKNAQETILLEPYEEYVRKFNEAFGRLMGIAPTVDSVNQLRSEEEELEFVQAFREMARIRNVLESFADFDTNDIAIKNQTYADYKSKYLDIREKVRRDASNSKESILHEVDFELELIARDEINVAYILKLIGQLRESEEAEREQKREEIMNLVGSEARLRSKRELIDQFIREQLPQIAETEDIPEAFDAYMSRQLDAQIKEFSMEENLKLDRVRDLFKDYAYHNVFPMRETIANLLSTRPSILVRDAIIRDLTDKIQRLVDTFFEGMG